MRNQGRFFIVLLLIGIIPFSQIIKAQNNPYKIDNQLYAYYQKSYQLIKNPEVMLMADTLFGMAVQKGDLKAQCLALNIKADYYYFTNNIDSLLMEKEKVADFARKTPYQQYIFGAWGRIITYYLRNRDYDKALSELKKYQEEAIRLNNAYGIGQSYIRMGDAYYQQRMTRLAIEQYLQAANYFHATGKENELYHPYAAISSCYIDLGENKKAEEYALKSLSIAPSLQAKINSYINLFRNYTPTDNIKKANEIKNILTEYKTQGLIKGSAAENFHIILTRYYYLTKDFAKAMQYSDSIHDEQLRFDCKSKIYAAQGNFKDAYHYCYKRLKLIDSTYQNQNAEILASYNARFNNQRLELEKNRLVLQNTEMRLKQSEDREQLMSMEKEQTRIELENRELQLEQQRTANELEKAENQKQRLKVIQKQEELQRIALKAESNRRKLIAIISSLLLITGFSIIYSITRRLHLKQLQKEMNAAEEARRQAEKADKLKSAFLQNLSHEIRTPLNAIVGFNDLLNDKEAEFSSEERQELLTHIHTNTDLLLTLVNDILDLSKLESGNYNVSLNKVVLTELCQSTLAGVAHRVAEGVNLKLLSPAEEIIITTDAQRLQQILTNLLVNACKYTKQGSITLAYAPENDKIIFSVTDTGCGISKDKSELIFQRFEKLDSINPGFGLGLSICRSLTALLGGRIYLDSDYSKGAKFVVELPL